MRDVMQGAGCHEREAQLGSRCHQRQQQHHTLSEAEKLIKQQERKRSFKELSQND